jgi:hypothetical protein
LGPNHLLLAIAHPAPKPSLDDVDAAVDAVSQPPSAPPSTQKQRLVLRFSPNTDTKASASGGSTSEIADELHAATRALKTGKHMLLQIVALYRLRHFSTFRNINPRQRALSTVAW